MEKIFKEVRELQIGDQIEVEASITSRALRDVRTFAKVSNWGVVCRSSAQNKEKCIIVRIS